MTDYTETEVKLFYPDLGAVARGLLKAGAKLVTPRVFERNVRYENANHTLSMNGIVVRLRQDYRTRLTYKGPAQVADGIVQRYEAEVEVSDFDAMNAILRGLGYQQDMMYEKYRTTYELDECEIVLDEMPYGNFVEIEGEAAAIERVIQTLGLSSAKRYENSYTGLFKTVKQNLGLNMRDLIFEHFDGVDVPESAFASRK